MFIAPIDEYFDCMLQFAIYSTIFKSNVQVAAATASHNDPSHSILNRANDDTSIFWKNRFFPLTGYGRRARARRIDFAFDVHFTFYNAIKFDTIL